MAVETGALVVITGITGVAVYAMFKFNSWAIEQRKGPSGIEETISDAKAVYIYSKKLGRHVKQKYKDIKEPKQSD
jgi:hypothetical protein